MRTRLLASLGSKVAIGVAATTLAAGSAGAVALQTISHDKPETPDVENVHLTNTPAQDDDVTTRTTEADDEKDADADEAKDADADETEKDDADATHEHPDNFGAVVSKDAQDGGVDGHVISQMARARQHGESPGTHGEADDDHGQDGAEVSESHKSGHGDDSDETEKDDDDAADS